MKFELFSQVSLACDIPERGLRRGDIATVVDYHAVENGGDGYSLEVFNALGETLLVVTVAASDIQLLRADEVLHTRPLEVI